MHLNLQIRVQTFPKRGFPRLLSDAGTIASQYNRVHIET